MPLPAFQLEAHAGLLLDLAEAMRESSKHSPLARKEIRDRLREIDAAGDPLGLVAKLRELVNSSEATQ